MFTVEDVVDSREADVLVAAAVARDEVLVEQLVVILGVAAASVHSNRVADSRASVRTERAADNHRRSAVRDVVKERMARAHGRNGLAGCDFVAAHHDGANRQLDRRRVHRAGNARLDPDRGAGRVNASEDLRHPVGATHEFTVEVHAQDRDVADV